MLTNCNFVLRYIIIICLLIIAIVILYKIMNYNKVIKNIDSCELIDEWSLEDEIRKFTYKQDLLLQK
jgi:hypothetical protein